MINEWRHVSRRAPCPVCGKPDWCGVSTDEAWVICRRLDTGEGQQKIDKAGGMYWLYRRHGHPPAPSPCVEIPVSPEPVRASPERLDHIYRALLGQLSLSAQHRAQLHRRGLSDVEIEHRQYRTLSRDRRAELARALVERFGPKSCAAVPGLYVRRGDARQWWSLAGAAGLLIPVRTPAHHIIALLVRRDADDEPRYSALSSKKYGGPGPGAHVHCPVFEPPSVAVVRLTEGPLKADIATVLSGILTLGVPGVSAWRQVLPILTAMQVKTVAIAFDADARRNWHVARALQRTVEALLAARFEVVLERWAEQDGKGIDDLLAAGQVPEVVEGVAMREAMRAIVRAARIADPLLTRQRLLGIKRRYVRQYRLPAVDPWLGSRETLYGIPIAVARMGEEVSRGYVGPSHL
jgi:Domain of unknown function (DUF3854)